MVVYKLTYFNLRGMGENIRLLFAKAGVEYEDNRIEFAQWESLKKDAPWGKVPTLEMDGLVMSHSVVIAKYLAEKFDLLGKSDAEKLKAAEIVMSGYDVFAAYSIILFQSGISEEKKPEAKKGVDEKVSGPYMTFLNEIAKKNEHGYLVGDSITWADLMVNALYYTHMEHFQQHFPELVRSMEKVAEDPNIKKWLEERPVTEH